MGRTDGQADELKKAPVKLVVGGVYTAHDQGTCITPQTRSVTVVWFDDRDVHYRLEGTGRVLQTPLDRFLDIVYV